MKQLKTKWLKDKLHWLEEETKQWIEFTDSELMRRSFELEDRIKLLENKLELASTPSDALEILKEKLSNSPNFSHGWHCNIAMACSDTFISSCIDSEELHRLSNETASRFMKLAFDIVTSNDMLSSE